MSLPELLRGALPVRTVGAGQTLFRQGDPGDSMVVVCDGWFRLDVRGARTQGASLGEFGPGSVLGEMTCLDPAPRSATVVAATDAVVQEIDRGTLASLRDRVPAAYLALMRAVLAQVAQRIRETDRRVDTVSRALQASSFAFPRAPAAGGAGSAKPSTFVAKDLEVLAQAARRRTLAAGETLCREGEPAGSCFLVQSGAIEVVKGATTAPTTLATLRAATVAGQVGLLDCGPRTASLVAGEPSVVLELDQATFQRLVEARVPFAVRFQEHVAVTGIRQLRSADRWLAVLSDHRVEAEVRQATAPRPAGEATPALPARAAARTVPDVPAAPPSQAPARTAGDVFDYMKAALENWGMSLEDLDRVQVARPAGLPISSAAHRRPVPGSG